jgi:hypothetical protein
MDTYPAITKMTDGGAIISHAFGSTGDSSFSADFYLCDCSSWIISPKDRREIFPTTELNPVRTVRAPSSGTSLTRFRLAIRVPGQDRHGLQLSPGKRMSVRVGIQTSTDLRVWKQLFERNRMMQVELR